MSTTPLPQMPIAPVPGQVLGGKYRVVRSIGEGGMGVVLEAEHLLSGKRVAIKWLHPKMAAEPDAEQRFVREARAAARVRHPNVVDVYDVVQAKDGVFLVMELLIGEPLTSVLERGQLPVPELIGILIEAMRGVSEAHKQGVVHRDIKPDNIFLAHVADQRKPCPKVLDFGISKLIDNDNLNLTQTGMALGTPLYMSYEQLQGSRDVDARTDVYAFAVILYEALTGQPPFYAETFSQLLVKIATQDALPPKALRAEVPTGLDRALQRALAKDRTQRTPTLAALIDALEPFASESAFRAKMTAQHARMPAIRPPSAPDVDGRVPSASGFRPASKPPPRGRPQRTPSEDALDRMRPRLTGLWLSLALLALGGVAIYFATRGDGKRGERATELGTGTTATKSTSTPTTMPAVRTPAATAPVRTAPAPSRPVPDPPAAEPVKPAHARTPRTPRAPKPPAAAAVITPAPATSPPSKPAQDSAPPHLRAGHPQRQDF